MPLLWLMSTFMVMYILMSMIECFYNTRVCFVEDNNYTEEMNLNKYTW